MITVSLHEPPDEPAAREPMWLQRRLVLAGAALMAALLVAAGLAFVKQQRSALLADALARNALFIQVLEDQANRSMDSAELVLAATGQALKGLPRPVNPAEVAALLRHAVETLPLLRSVSLVSSQGLLLASSAPDNLARPLPRHRLLSVIAVPGLGGLTAGADLGQTQADPPAGAAAFHLPLVRPVPGDGATDWLVATLRPEHFSAHYSALLGAGAPHAALLSQTGQLVAASPGLGLAPGTRLAQHRVFAEFLATRSQGQFDGPGLGGQPSHISFRAARLQPLVVLVETPEAAVAQQGDALALRVAGVVGVLLLMVGALAAAVWRSQQTREAVSGDLAAARDSIAAHDAFTDRLFQVSPIPMVVKDTHGRFLRVNRAWTDLTGLSYERVIGFSLGRLYPAQLAAPHMVQEQMAIASGQPVN